MSKKNKIFLLAAAIIVAVLAVAYKIPKGIDDILPYPYDFDNAFSHDCIAVIPEKQRMHFPPDDGKTNYDEIHELLSEAEFISDFRNIAPIKQSFPKYAVSGSKIFIDHDGASIATYIYSGTAGAGRCTVNFHDDGTVYITTQKYRDVIWSYRLKDKDFFNELWDYIEENGSVYVKEAGEEHWKEA